MGRLVRLGLWALVLGVSLLYLPINRLAQGGVALRTPLDDLIPLWPVWAVPYLASVVWWLGASLWAALRMEDGLYRALVAAMLIVNLAGFAIYLLFPTYVERPALSGTDWATSLVRFIYSQDRVYNAFPSGHTYITVLIALFWWRWQPRLRWLWIGGTLLILLSTLFTRQHFLADLLGGIVLAVTGWWLGRRIGSAGEPAEVLT